MKPWKIVFFLMLSALFFFSGPSYVDASESFSGRNYLKMESAVRTFYVSGFVHGMSIVRQMADENAILPWLEKCIQEMSPIQFEEVMTGYIREHPELQDARLDVLAFLAFKVGCRK